jgi:hypothetical protein
LEETGVTNTPFRTHLRQLLVERFNDGELRTFCFDLGVDYDDLSGSGKADKARELVNHLERRDALFELVRVGQHTRPDVPWLKIETTDPQPGRPTDRPAIQAGRDVYIPGTVIIGGIQGNVTIGQPSGNE